jgi:hypothetical protein
MSSVKCRVYHMLIVEKTYGFSTGVQVIFWRNSKSVQFLNDRVLFFLENIALLSPI